MTREMSLVRSPEAAAARRWLLLAVGVLVLAGAFALALVVARMPPFDTWITDPLFFRRALVVHVNLSLVCWFYAFVAALLFLLPSRQGSSRFSRHTVGISAAGVLFMVAAAGSGGAEPVLSNYVPMIDHPMFGYGLGLFALGVISSFTDRRLFAGAEGPGFFDIPASARPPLRAAAIALLLAALTFFGSWLTRPTNVTPDVLYELVFWGPGHVLQAASVLAMAAVWLILLGAALGHSVMQRGTSSALFAFLLAPWFAAPVLAMQGVETATYRVGFTRLMQLAIFPAILVVLALCLKALWGSGLGRGWWKDPRLSGFAVSAGLTVLGFVLGAMIRGSNTVVPAHYHASIGAVTASFMAMTYVLMAPLGLRLPEGRTRTLAAIQPMLFGVGQMVFASGFALAGAHGMARKVYGQEQAGRSLMETFGLGVMGLGGLVAVAGGLLFLGLVFRSWQLRVRTASERRSTWNLLAPPIRSNG